jgi:hypothetical protein
LILFNKQTQGQKELYEEARQLVVDLRAVQDLAFSSQGIDSETPCGYGIELFPDLTGYEVFAALSVPGRTCADIQAGFYVKQLVDNLPFFSQGRVSFSNLEVYSYTANPVIFVPPYPKTIFFPQNTQASFQFFNKKVGQGSLVEIQLNQAGQITIQEP